MKLKLHNMLSSLEARMPLAQVDFERSVVEIRDWPMPEALTLLGQLSRSI